LIQKTDEVQSKGEAIRRVSSRISFSSSVYWIFRLGFVRVSLVCAWTIPLVMGASRAADLSFEQRVRAQEAIQRVYYRHQLNTTLPFGEVFSREVLETQVRDMLRKSAALELTWKNPVTPAALRAEMERIARSSRFPGRLEEIYAALDHDPLLVEECFARASLVDRLARSFFVADSRIHAESRARAEALRARLVGGDLSPTEDNPERWVAEVTPEDPGFPRWRASLPERAGDIGPLLDQEAAFSFQVVLEESEHRVKVATYSVAKKSWSAWWAENGSRFSEDGVKSVASRTDALLHPSGTDQEFPGAARGISTQAADCLQATWNNGSLDDVPSPRAQHTAVWTGSLMIVWGGTAPVLFSSFAFEVFNTGGRYDPLTDTWTPTSTLNAPEARTQHSAIWTGSVMVVWGGTRSPNQGSQALTTGGGYNPATDTWTTTSTIGVTPARYRHTAVWTGTRMIVWGGYESNGVPSRLGGRYNPATDSWTSMSESFGLSRFDYSVVWTGTEMLVWGGTFSLPLNSGMKYNPATDTWSAFGATNPPEARSQHGAVWTGSRMIVWGGKNDSVNLTTGGQYNPANDSWTPISTTFAASGLRPSSVWTGSRMLTWNGSSMRQYDPAADAWMMFEYSTSETQTNDSVVWTGTQMIVWGGLSNSIGVLDAGWRYDAATNAITPTSASSMPSPREGHSAIWTGTLMILWGGHFSSPAGSWPLQTGARYDPLTDSWTSMSQLGAPSANIGHTAVWTGTYMATWGWDSLAQNPGGRYNPATDTWTSITNVQGPPPHKFATAVWTGSRMLIWGGEDSSGVPVNTGGSYDPAGNTWTGMATTNAPSPRSHHSAVWTGNRMIIWGGNGFGNSFNTGGSYDPQANSWSSISTVNAPYARTLHAAVWSGSQMIVWGGTGKTTGSLYDGGRYTPQNNTWIPISTVGAPSSRAEHTAVWTGSEMVVWGGYRTDASTPFAWRVGGGRYNPATDTWKGLPTVGSPSSRIGHTAIWTGNHMIVWGGTHSGQERSGGRLRFDVLPDVDADQDGFSFCGGDCDDSNPAVHPGATETCNGIDDDCAVAVDNGFDQDGDGFTSCGGDCNDSNPAISPAAPEVCDHFDENCDGALDDGFPNVDGDGYAACIDCNDMDFHIYPGAPESCNGKDDDCNSVVDDGGDALCDSNPGDCFHGTCGGSSGCLSGNEPLGTPCNDANGCTQTDTCNGSGTCTGSNPVACTPLDSCHNAGTCSPASGLCSNPAKPMGTPCEDGDPCTMMETCNILAVCGGGAPTDLDFDGHSPAACGGDDCNDTIGSAWSAPVEVTNLRLTAASPANPSWDSQAEQAGFGTIYDLTSGTLSGSGGLNGGSAVCLLSGSSSISYNDSRPGPATGTGFWYLTRAKNSCGVGSYGFASNSAERSIPACP
jgi:N-acetylneuraminic acid mutarotase